MAVNNSNVIGIRQELNGRGIDNSRIGYNGQTGYVTIDGQNFLQPVQATQGVSYADPTAFNNAYTQFDTRGKVNNAETTYMDAVNTPYTNPIDSQIAALMEKINAAMNPAAYDATSDPGYAAYQAQSQRAAQQGIRSAQESMGAAGFGRSTNLADRAQHIQNDQQEYMQLQVIPQLQAAHQAQQQQQLSSLMGLLDALSGQQGVYDQRHNTDVDRLGRTLEYVTGRADHAEEVAYRDARDKIADKQYQQTFDENKRQFGLKFALEKAVSEHQMSVDDAQLAISRMNAQTSRMNAENDNTRQEATKNFSEKMKIWEATGVAPAGIDGVAAGTKWGGSDSIDFGKKMEIWKASGVAPDGIPGVNPGTPYGGGDPQNPGIDDYDLAVIDTLVSKKGLKLGKMTPADTRSFVGELKSQYGWSTEESKQVEDYLLSKNSSAASSKKKTSNKKPNSTKPPSSGKMLTPFPGLQ